MDNLDVCVELQVWGSVTEITFLRMHNISSYKSEGKMHKESEHHIESPAGLLIQQYEVDTLLWRWGPWAGAKGKDHGEKRGPGFLINRWGPWLIGDNGTVTWSVGITQQRQAKRVYCREFFSAGQWRHAQRWILNTLQAGSPKKIFAHWLPGRCSRTYKHPSPPYFVKSLPLIPPISILRWSTISWACIPFPSACFILLLHHDSIL